MDNLEAIEGIKYVVEQSFCREIEEMLKEGGSMARVLQSAQKWADYQNYLISAQLEQETKNRTAPVWQVGSK